MILRTCFSLAILLPALSWSGSATVRGEVVIATYNIRYANPNDGKDVWKNRRETVVKYLADKDIFGLQEVTASQYEYLRENLSDFATYGVGRDDGERGGEHSPIFYRKERFEPLRRGTFWLSEQPEEVGESGWDAALPRICTWMILRDRNSGQEFCVANTHFDHRGKVARDESAKLLAERSGELPAEMPVVLMGDFNCQPGSDPYQTLTATLSDARKVTQSPPRGPDSTWNGFRAIEPQRIIDHVFVRNVDVVEFRVDDPKTQRGRFGSDHLPVRITLRLAKP